MNVRRDPTLVIISRVHGQYMHSRTNTSTRICLNKHERLIKKYHKTRTGIKPASSDNRSDIPPIELSGFLSSQKQSTTYPNIRSICIRTLGQY